MTPKPIVRVKVIKIDAKDRENRRRKIIEVLAKEDE